MAKQKGSAGRAKTDPRYWQSKIFRPFYVRGGERIEVRAYSARIGWMKERHTFGLGTSNAEAAAKEAAKIYGHLLLHGWDATLAKFAPRYAPKPDRPATVGDYVSEAMATASIDPRTLADYVASFRRVVSDIAGIDSTVSKKRRRRVGGKLVESAETVDARFSYRNGSRDEWISKVDAVPLARITPARLQKWKLAYVRERAGGDLARERSAKISCNTILRKARGLFSKKVLPHVRESLTLPEPLPFAGIEFFPRQSMRYTSRIDAGELVRQAAEELAESEPESFKVFLLAIGAGLRAKEIDSLTWQQFDVKARTISIEATPFFKPKSEDSIGLVEIDPETAEILQGYRASASGIFVIESDRAAKPNASYHYLRARDAFETLYQWLRAKGVSAKKPLHEMRKEFGSQICKAFGIHAASRALRHADVQITAAHYLDQERVTIGLGRFLSPKVIPFEAGKDGTHG